ncbi:MAG: aspartyl protease family protein [Saprospiraceae bacterium]|nr:aspartyl protease family protein [Saprospiraceae bacterium]
MRCLLYILLALPFCTMAQNKIAFLGCPQENQVEIKIESPAYNDNSFVTEDGLIYIHAAVNGNAGVYLLDTGAPSLVLNQKTSPLTSTKTSKAFAVSSNLPVSFVEINQFQWGEFRKDVFEGLMLDLNHFEGPHKAAIDGLIGFDILEGKVLMVDYQNNQIDLLKSKAFKSIKKEDAPSYSIDFDLYQHLPVIEVTIDGKMYKLALDTGAEKNLLHTPIFKDLAVENVEYDLLQGLDKHIKKVSKGYLNHLEAGEYRIQRTQFLFTDLSHIQSDAFGYDIDGLLGLDFFEGRKFAVDYRKHKIYIW